MLGNLSPVSIHLQAASAEGGARSHEAEVRGATQNAPRSAHGSYSGKVKK